MRDLRRFGRWQIDQRAQIKIAESPQYIPCTVHDINLKGVKVSFAQKLNADTFVQVVFSFSPDFSFSAQAWVVWHKSADGHNIHGLYFTRIQDRDREKLYQFMHKHFPRAIAKQWWTGVDEAKEGGEQMQTAQRQDKRVFERFTARMPLRFLDLGSNCEGAGSTCDISAKGVGFLTDTELRPATPLELWLEIPDKGEPLYARAEVVWSKPEGADAYRTGVNLERADLMGLSRVMRAG